jgi:hypothetical protein
MGVMPLQEERQDYGISGQGTTVEQHVFTTHGQAVRYLWTESDPITLSKELTEYLATEGIRFGVSPPYQHEKNDKTERTHKPLGRLITVLLHAGRLPLQMWAKAHAVAIGILNITPTR